MQEHLKFRGLVRQVNLEQLKRQFTGSKYSKLIQEHIRKSGYDIITNAIDGCVAAFNATESEVVELLIDEYNELGYERNFWRRDCCDVFSEICGRFEDLLKAKGHAVEDKMKFNMFQLITLNFAQMALEQKELRKFAGIRKGYFFR